MRIDMIYETKTYKGISYDIGYDNFADNPREYDEGWFGTLALWHRRYNLVNETELPIKDYNSLEELANDIYDTYDVKYMYVVTKYDHSNVSLSFFDYDDFSPSKGFDTSTIGLMFVTKKAWENAGISRIDKKLFDKKLAKELQIYENYLNGNIFQIDICLDNVPEKIRDNYLGETTCGGFYEIKDADEYAKNIIDSIIKKSMTSHLVYLKKIIKKKVPLIYRKPNEIINTIFKKEV